MRDDYNFSAEARDWRDAAEREFQIVLFIVVCLVMVLVGIYIQWNPDEPQNWMFVLPASFLLVITLRGYDWFRFRLYARNAANGESRFFGKKSPD